MLTYFVDLDRKTCSRCYCKRGPVLISYKKICSKVDCSKREINKINSFPTLYYLLAVYFINAYKYERASLHAATCIR